MVALSVSISAKASPEATVSPSCFNLVALLLAAAILGEALTWPLLLAGAVIVAGVAIVQTGAKHPKRYET